MFYVQFYPVLTLIVFKLYYKIHIIMSVPKCFKEDFKYQLIPRSVLAKWACRVLYDWHPMDNKKIDITICSKDGYIQEYYKKDLINSIKIDCKNFKQIKILRNSRAEMFYVVLAEHQIIILLRKEKLHVHRIFNFHDVETCEIVDSECTGEAKLKIVTTRSVIHLSIDNNFNNMEEESGVISTPEDTKPVLNILKQKLNEAKYNLERNENAYKNILNLRQSASYSSQDIQTETLTPTVIFCNKKILIILELKNPCNEAMEKVCTLIHNNSCNSISYSSKLFEILPSSPYYREIENQEIKGKETAVIVAVIAVKEFDSSVSSKIEFNVVVSYQKSKKNYLQPCDNVYVSTSEVMGKNFDVFSSEVYDDPKSLHLKVLALLSATEKTTLCIKQILTHNCKKATPALFCEYLCTLGMEFLDGGNKVLVFKHSPQHMLYGIMIIFHEVVQSYELFEFDFKIDVYTRSPSQVLALIHFIYDSIPLELIVTTPNIEITSTDIRGTQSQDYDEEMDNNFPQLDYTHLASSLLKQASMTLAYFDECLKKSNTKDSADHNIDIFAMGLEKFAEYRRNMIAEAEKGIEHLPRAVEAKIDEDFDVNMEID